MALLSKAKRKEAVHLAKQLTYYELTNVSNFQDMFMMSLDIAKWQTSK